MRSDMIRSSRRAAQVPSRATGKPTPTRTGLLQRSGVVACLPGTRDHDGESQLQRSASGSGHDFSRVSVHTPWEVLRSPGQPLDQSARALLEPRFGHDFGQVRVHADETAAESAKAVDALAYTVGQHIVFGAGQYSPHSHEGRRILAHELAHTIQQGSDVQRLPGELATTDPTDAMEREAHAAAETVVRGGAVAPLPRSTLRIARQAPPVAPAKKKVTVNVTNLHGATASIGGALTYANTQVYHQADVEIIKGKEVTLDQTKSKAILGNDLIVDEYTNPATPTTEEQNLLKENQSAGAVTVYFVKGFDKGSLGEAFWPSSGSGLVGFVVGRTRPNNTFSHELGHVLLDDGGHAVPDATYLMHSTAHNPKKLTAAQIAKIKASGFVK